MAFVETKLEHWIEWKQKCAVDLCLEETRNALMAYGGAQILNRLKGWDSRILQDLLDQAAKNACLPIREGWRILETFLHETPNKSPIRHKDWLFAQASKFSHLEPDSSLTAADANRIVPAQVALQKVMAGVVKTAVRRHCERLLKELPKTNGESLDAPLSLDGDEACTRGTVMAIEDFPDADAVMGTKDVSPDDAAARAEMRNLALAEAKALEPGLSDRECLLLVAHDAGMAMSDPLLLEAAGVKKSVTSAGLNGLVRRVCQKLAQQYSQEDPADVRLLQKNTLEYLVQLAEQRISPEIKARLGLLPEGKDDELF